MQGQKKIWFGNIEIERDKEALLKLSRRIGPLYILWEMDGRFLDFIPAICYVKSRAAVTVEDGFISYSKEFAEYIEGLRERLSKNTKNSTRMAR